VHLLVNVKPLGFMV